MRVLVAGASGVIGRQLLPLLEATGHETIVLVHRTPIAADGIHTVRADVLDRGSLTAAVTEFAPDAVVNLLTAIPRALNPRRFAQQFAPTNRLRSEGTANLIAAAPGARIISESVAFGYAPRGGALADESRPLWADGPAPFRPAVAALAEMERLTAAAGGLSLRFGHLYGPGTGFAADGPVCDRVRAGRMPIVGDGAGLFSFTHTHDAATAIVAALDKPDLGGAVNVVDDEPMPTARWLPALAQRLRAPAPRRVPAWLARLAVGPWGVAYMNGLAGATNARAHAELDWRPRYRTVLEGWDEELVTAVAA